VFAVLSIDHSTLDDAKILFKAQALKVLSRAQMDIGRVVPVMGQMLGYGHMSS
jgi:hypothetical protein